MVHLTFKDPNTLSWSWDFSCSAKSRRGSEPLQADFRACSAAGQTRAEMAFQSSILLLRLPLPRPFLSPSPHPNALFLPMALAPYIPHVVLVEYPHPHSHVATSSSPQAWPFMNLLPEHPCGGSHCLAEPGVPKLSL